jgi:hypothetical protein
MKTFGESGGRAPRIFNVGSKSELMMSFTFRLSETSIHVTGIEPQSYTPFPVT